MIYEAGGPEVLRIENRPVPVPQPGEVLIVVNAFGLRRSELFTRQGLSPDVTFPRVLGIEAVGVVDDAPGNEFASGDVVATAMDGMGREFDGGYAKYTCVPARQVQVLNTARGWEVLGAVPEMLQTAWGSLFKSLRLGAGERLLASCFAGQITISPQVSGEPSLQFWCGKVDESTNFEGLLSAAEINDIHRQRRWFEAF